MFNTILHSIAKVLVVPLVAVMSYAGYNIQSPVPNYSLDISHLQTTVASLQDQVDQNQSLGGTNTLPTSVAIFSTSLQTQISATANSMTLVSASYENGAATLASSTYDFIIDQGNTNQEFVSADCTGTVCTNISRGLDWVTGQASVPSLEFTHRRGASVQITDAPVLLKLNSLALGTMGYPNQIGYKTGFASTSITQSTSFTDKDYVDGRAFSGAGAIKATTGAVGYVQLATQLQQASSTPTSSTNPLVLQSANATSTCGTTAGLDVIIANNSGRLDGSCFPSTITASTTFSNTATSSVIFAATSSVQIGSFPAYQIGKNLQIFSSTGISTFNVPSGITTVYVKAIAGGGGGGGTCGGTSSGGGGGGGGYSEGPVNVSASSSIQVTVGTGGTAGVGNGCGTPSAGGSGGASYFGPSNNSYINTIGGGGGAIGNSSAGQGGGGGAGNSGTNYINMTGTNGTDGQIPTSGVHGGYGGVAAFGGSYGEGGGGGTGSNGSGGGGTQGIVIITW